ncbi:MAG: non-heme iron oxygenase ferredoxin subunit [Betaproteobacteria bacterium]|nr:MAG: non-heme iron oxygenase ferredoxin subunit [Betaproteobacteria bacterium]
MPRSDLVPLCKTADVAPGSVKRADAPGFPPLAVFNLAGSFYVTDDTCTHGQASLSEGYVEESQVECPWHGGRFCLRTGQPLAFPAVEPIRDYPDTIVGDEVCISEPPSES